MAKNKKMQSKTAKSQLRRKKTVRVTTITPQPDALDQYARAHAKMLWDPCGAELSESVYPGDRGYVNRFTNNQGLGVTATDTVFALIVKPGNQVQHASAAATLGATTTIAYGTGSFPGQAFLATNAAKARCISHCVTVRPNAAPSSGTGTIHYGIINASALPNGKSLSFNDIQGFCTESVSASQALMAPLEIKWSPGGFDDRYNGFTAGAPAISDDDSDRNVLVVLFSGYPAGSGALCKYTTIQEWAPNVALGVVCDATSVKKSVCDVQCVLRNLKRKDANWWWQLGTAAAKGASAIASGYYTGGPVGAMTAAKNSFTKISKVF